MEQEVMYQKKKGKSRNQVLKSGQRRIRGSATVCVRKEDEVRKVKRAQAEVMVGTGWSYCPKKEWKLRHSNVAIMPELNKVEAVAETVAVETPKKKKKK
jgi:hypothetical protein